MKTKSLWILATLVLFSCGRSNAPVYSDEVMRAVAAKPHRIAVVFWPQVTGCDTCDQMISGVISEWQAAPDAEMVVVSVVSERIEHDDPWWPGTVVRLKAEDHKRYAGKSPRPRVEIWSARGELLLSRSVPNYGSQVELLTEEMLAARSFTAPLAVAQTSP